MSTNTKLAEAARLDAAIKDLPDGCEGWLEPLDERIAELRAALAAPDAEQAAKAVPAGFVLVPVEPTPEMLKAADLEHASRGLVSIAIISYRAMLAAAPTPPAPEAQQPAGQEQDERAAFEAWFSGFRHGWKSEKEVASDAWRAALAQRREPLTASQVNELCNECHLDWHRGWSLDEEPNRYLELARAIERAHGIGATTGKEPGNV